MGWFDSVTPSQFLPFTTSPLFWFDGYDIPFRGFSFQSIRGLIIGHGVVSDRRLVGIAPVQYGENASLSIKSH